MFLSGIPVFFKDRNGKNILEDQLDDLRLEIENLENIIKFLYEFSDINFEEEGIIDDNDKFYHKHIEYLYEGGRATFELSGKIKYISSHDRFYIDVIDKHSNTRLGEFPIKMFLIRVFDENNYDLYVYVHGYVSVYKEKIMENPYTESYKYFPDIVDESSNKGVYVDFRLNSANIEYCLDKYFMRDPENPNEWIGLDEYELDDSNDYSLGDFIDPITHQIMENPYTASDNQNYDLNSILMLKEDAERKGRPLISPITREVLEKDDDGNLILTENTELKEKIEDHLYDNPQGNTYERNYYMVDPDLNPQGRMDMTGSPLKY